jgi:hypothetical protein
MLHSDKPLRSIVHAMPSTAARVTVLIALVTGAVVGLGLLLAARFVVELVGPGAVFGSLCTGCNASGHPSMTAMISLFGVVGSAWSGSQGKPPGGMVYDAYKIASASTPEGQQDAAVDAFQGLVGTKGAPPGSPGGDLNDAMDKVKSFGKIDLGQPPP